VTLHVSNAKWTPSDEQEGRENSLEMSQTGSVTRERTFETKDKSMNYFSKTLRSSTWQRSRWAGAVTVPCTIGTALTVRIGKNSSVGSSVLAATVFRIHTWLVASNFAY